MALLPDHVRENLLRSAAIIFPRGLSPSQGSRDFVYAITGSLSNAFKKCGLTVRLGIDSELRSLTGLTIFSNGRLHTIPMMVTGGVLTLGKERMYLNKPDSVEVLVRAVLKAVAEVADSR